jgi:hypothetical protein
MEILKDFEQMDWTKLRFEVSPVNILNLTLIPAGLLFYVGKFHPNQLKHLGSIALLMLVYFNFFAFSESGFMNYIVRASWFVALMRAVDFIYFTPSNVLKSLSTKEFISRLLVAQSKPLHAQGTYEKRNVTKVQKPTTQWTEAIFRRLPPFFSRNFMRALLSLLMQYLVWNCFLLYFKTYPYRQVTSDDARQFTPLSLRAFFENYVYGCMFYFCLNMVHTALYGVLLCPLFDIPYKPIFNAPFMATSASDLWSRRWNLMVKENFHHLVFKPTLSFLANTQTSTQAQVPSEAVSNSVEPTATEATKRQREQDIKEVDKSTRRPQIKRSHLAIAGVVTFLFSGVMHEYTCIGAFPQQPIYFEHTIFFLLNALLVLAQQFIEALILKRSIDSYPKWITVPIQTFLTLFMSSFFLNPFMRQRLDMNFGIPTLF